MARPNFASCSVVTNISGRVKQRLTKMIRQESTTLRPQAGTFLVIAFRGTHHFNRKGDEQAKDLQQISGEVMATSVIIV